MDREAKIKRITEVIANKELSFGCIITDPADQEVRYVAMHKHYKKQDHRYYWGLYGSDWGGIHNSCEIGIVGHPVMIGDVLDWADKSPIAKTVYMGVLYTLSKERKDKRKPINNQSDRCIDSVYNMLGYVYK